MTSKSPDSQRAQLQEQRRRVDFDSYDVTVDELIRRLSKGRIEIAPSYQRQFRWNTQRQSRLIESLLLGIPVPPLFMATNTDESTGTSWEVVDGLQRLLTLAHFLGDSETLTAARLPADQPKLRDLEILSLLNGLQAKDLPTDIRTGLEDRPMKVIVLNDKSDLQVRFDLFDRLNTGGVALTNQEVRESVFTGEFVNLLNELCEIDDFRTVVKLPDSNQRDGTPQEYVLRFFAFYDDYQRFDHSVKDFLNEYCEAATLSPDIEVRRKIFRETFSFLSKAFPEGLKSRKGTTAVNLFEGIAAGAALALEQDSSLNPPSNKDWVVSDDLKKFTTGATNNRSRVTGRVEFCRDKFIQYG